MSSIPSLAPRDRYAALERCTYLNQASLGLIPEPAIVAMDAFLRLERHQEMSDRHQDGADDDGQALAEHAVGEEAAQDRHEVRKAGIESEDVRSERLRLQPSE